MPGTPSAYVGAQQEPQQTPSTPAHRRSSDEDDYSHIVPAEDAIDYNGTIVHLFMYDTIRKKLVCPYCTTEDKQLNTIAVSISIM